MDSTALEATASSSDCQFCRVRFQKSAAPRYWNIVRGAVAGSRGPVDGGSVPAGALASVRTGVVPGTDWLRHGLFGSAARVLRQHRDV